MVDYKQEENLKLSDVVNIELLQKFQDAFAEYMDVASITVDNQGPVTEPSNFTDFCIKYIRTTDLGYKKCNECDIKGGQVASSKHRPTIYKCHSGLTDFAVPIMLGEKHIGSILGGQVLTEKPDEERYRLMAKNLGIEDEEGYIRALHKIKIVPPERIEAIANLLFLTANLISEMANKNFELIKKNNREKLLAEIIETIRGTLDIDKILSFICDEVAKLFNVQRSIIVEFSDKVDKGYVRREEYKSRADIQSFIGSEYEKKLNMNAKEILFSYNDFVTCDNISDAYIVDDLKTFYEETGLKSFIGTVVKKEDKVWGAIVLFEYDNYRHWTDDEISLLKAIAGQIYISIHQAELHAQTKLQAEREKAILNNLPFMAWLKDKDGRFLAVNETFKNKLNLSFEEILGRTDVDLFPVNIAQKYVTDDLKVMKTRQQMSVEEEIVQKDGVRWHETFKTPLFNQDGKVIGTTGFARDITERKEIELIKNEFVSTISHELRTPLTSIRGALGLVLSEVLGPLPEKPKELLSIASNNSIRLVNLINDILDLDKIKAGKMDFEFKEYEIMPLIQETVKLNEEYAKQYNVKYEISGQLNNTYVYVDKNRFIQVLTNLLSNAAKFSFPDEVVKIVVKKKKNNVLVSVVNKGIGIPKEAYPKIFESFSQVDSSNARKKGGSGLGLIITKSIIQKMGGEIGFTSKINDETDFYFELPQIVKNRKRKRVLICEDNNVIALRIQTMFNELGYISDIALSAADAKKLLQHWDYDLMTLEFTLPDKNGLELLQELKKQEKIKDLPVIVVSVSKPNFEVIDNHNNIFDWLEKSFDLEDLKKVVDKIMNERNKHKVEILHVENDEDILSIIGMTLKDVANFTKVTNLSDAEDIISNFAFDIIILDYVFPGSTCEKLIPIIKSGINKDAKLIVFSAYEASKQLANEVDAIFLKTNVSTEQFKNCVEKFIRTKIQKKN